MTIAVTFDLSGSANDGKIVLYAAAGATVPTAGNLNVYFGVTGPGGVQYKAFPSSPDFSFAALGSGTTTINIPRTSNGEYLSGEYEVRCYVDDDAGTPVVHYDATYTFDFQPSITPTSRTSSRISLDVVVDCGAARITATGTQPEAGSISEEEISVTPVDTDDETSTESDNGITYTFAFNGAQYRIDYGLSVEDDEPMDEAFTFYLIETLLISETVTTDCLPNDICGVVSCVEAEFKKLDGKICSSGWRSLSEKEKGRLMKATYMASMMQIFKNCGNEAKVKEYKTNLQSLLDCACPCGDAPSTSPQPYSV